MIIWLATVGEPSPIDTGQPRLLRTGMCANYLTEHGHQVTWWNSTFDHHKKTHRSPTSAIVQFSKGYSLIFLRGHGYTSHVSYKRILDHQQVSREFLRLAPKQPKPDIVVAAYPTIELADACGRFCRQYNIPFVVDIRDLWPDIFLNLAPAVIRPIAKLALSYYSRRAHRALANAKSIIGITEPYLKWALAKAKRHRGAHDVVIPFGYPCDTGQSNENDHFWDKYDFDRSRDFIVVFFGTFGRQFDLLTIIEAAKSLKKKNIRIVLCGDGDTLNHYRSSCQSFTESIIFPGWIDQPKIASLLRMAHIGIAPYYNGINFHGNIPNKPIEYMSASLPIITPLRGLLLDLITKEKIGLSYTEGDPNSLSRLLNFAEENRSAMTEMGHNARRVFDSSYASHIVLSTYMNHLQATSQEHHDPQRTRFPHRT